MNEKNVITTKKSDTSNESRLIEIIKEIWSIAHDPRLDATNRLFKISEKCEKVENFY